MPQQQLLVRINNGESHSTVVYTQIKRTLGISGLQTISATGIRRKDGFTVLVGVEREAETEKVIAALKEIKGVQEINIKD